MNHTTPPDHDPLAGLLDRLGAAERAAASDGLEDRVFEASRGELVPAPLGIRTASPWRNAIPIALAACAVMALSAAVIVMQRGGSPGAIAPRTVLVAATPEQELEGLLAFDELLSTSLDDDLDALYAQASALEIEDTSDLFGSMLFEESM